MARDGRLDEAQVQIDRVRFQNEEDRIVNLATRGLIKFRAGQAEEAVDLYRSAIDLALKYGVAGARLAYRAVIYLCYEQANMIPESAPEVLRSFDERLASQLKPGTKLPAHIIVEAKLIRRGIELIGARDQAFTPEMGPNVVRERIWPALPAP